MVPAPGKELARTEAHVHRQDRERRHVLPLGGELRHEEVFFLAREPAVARRGLLELADARDGVGVYEPVVRGESEPGVKREDSILIPTGDGMCIALISHELPYDIHMQLGLSVIKRLAIFNSAKINESRRFQVRIGINQNTDILVTDINDRLNVAGAGINMAARIMDKADGNQILTSRAVFDELQPSEKYMDRFHEFHATAKHGVRFPVYQLRGDEYTGLKSETPSEFVKEDKPEPALTKVVSYYFAHAIQNKQNMLEQDNTDGPAVMTLLWMLANDSADASKSTDIRPFRPSTDKYGEATFKEQVEHYSLTDFGAHVQFSEALARAYFAEYSNCMDWLGIPPCLVFINEKGMEKLRTERFDIWKEAGLDKYLSTR